MDRKKDRVIQKLLFSFFFLFLLFVFWKLFDTHILAAGKDGWLLTGESTFGDLPFHLSQISQMSQGGKFPPENPFFAGRPLTYPYAINFFSALLVKAGLSLRDSVLVPGIVLSMVLALSLYFFYQKVSKSRGKALLGTYLFFFYGGLGFYYFFKDIVFPGKLTEFLFNPGKFEDYSHLFSQNIHWLNFLSRIIVPERSVLLGIPLGLLILYLLFLTKKRDLKKILIAAVMTGLMPFFHTHTFIFFALTIPFLAILEIRKNNFKKWLSSWLIFGVVSLAIASPFLAGILTEVDKNQSFFRFHFGWMAKPGIINFFAFWLKNGGILIPLIIASLFLKRVPSLLKKLSAVSLLWFLLINLFLFQPFDWDNVKFLFWVTIFGALSSTYAIAFFWERKNFFLKTTAILLVLGLTLSSFPSLYREVKLQHGLFSREEVGLGSWVKESTKPNSLFLTAPIHKSFVNNLGGRKILMGYPGLLWVHGFDFDQRLSDVKIMYLGGDQSLDLIESYGIDYVVVGPYERSELKPAEEFFNQKFQIVKETENYRIFLTR